MTDVQRNRWFLQFQQMHQTMWGFNPHGAEYFNSEMLLETVTQAADFFGLPMPKVTEVEDTVARIKTNEEAQETVQKKEEENRERMASAKPFHIDTVKQFNAGQGLFKETDHSTALPDKSDGMK